MTPSKLFDLSRELYSRFVTLGDHANKLGTAHHPAPWAPYNQFASSLESRVLVTARKLQAVDGSKIIAQVGMLDAEKTNIRELNRPGGHAIARNRFGGTRR